MHTDTSRGTFQDVIRGRPREMAAITRKLRRLIVAVCPDVTEIPRPSEQHVEYGIGPRRGSEVFGYLCPMAEYVRLGFFCGAALPDPKGVLEGEGKRLRHIKVRSLAEAERPEVRRLIEAAVRERQQALRSKPA
jgi:hypothetical protein